MEDSKSFRQMQDEMSRFEAEISGAEILGSVRPVIGTGTYGAMQQQLERPIMPPQPPSGMMPPFNPMMGPRMMYPPMQPPPPPPNLMIPAQVQRMRPMMPNFPDSMHMNMSDGPGEVPSFIRAGLPGPQLLPPPPKPQPVVLSAKPQLYKKPEPKEEGRKEDLKRKRPATPPPRDKTPPRDMPAPAVAPPAPVVSTPYTSHTEPVVPKPKKEKKSRKVVRTAGGQTWEDVTLLEWADDDFRLFCGDLGNDVTDELLVRTFGKYASFQKAKVVRDKRTNKSKGFGFVSFKDPGDFIKAMKEMDGRYVGSRPIKLRKSTWRNRSLDIVRKKEKDKAALLAMLTTNT